MEFLTDERGTTTEWVSATAMFLTATTVLLVLMGSDDLDLSGRIAEGRVRVIATLEEARPLFERARDWVGL